MADNVTLLDFIFTSAAAFSCQRRLESYGISTQWDFTLMFNFSFFFLSFVFIVFCCCCCCFGFFFSRGVLNSRSSPWKSVGKRWETKNVRASAHVRVNFPGSLHKLFNISLSDLHVKWRIVKIALATVTRNYSKSFLSLHCFLFFFASNFVQFLNVCFFYFLLFIFKILFIHLFIFSFI